MKRTNAIRRSALPLAALGAGLLLATASARAQTYTWTTDGDFEEGSLVNVNHDNPFADQLQLSFETVPFPFINIAASGRGTIIRIDTETGSILGEYRTAPLGRSLNPSRTTVDLYGNVWAGNRDEAGGTPALGSVVKVGLTIGGTRCDHDGTPNPLGAYVAPPYEFNTSIDRDFDGMIKTSRGLGNVLDWPDLGDGTGGTSAMVEDAEDEAIMVYQRVGGTNIRHLSVDANNNVWVGGYTNSHFDLLDGDDGSVLASFNVGYGGYGGLVDGNGVLWASHRSPHSLLRYDTKGTITTADDTWNAYTWPDVLDAYGLGLDTFGNVWHTQYAQNQVHKFAPDGTLLGAFGTGGSNGDRGVAITSADDNVWVANSWGSDVSRLDNNGNLLKVIGLGFDGQMPTGVAVDAEGKVWVTCRNSDTAKRIDPAGGGDGLGAVDLTVDLGAGAAPYNYSDMTGSVLLQAVQQGTWTVVYDSELPGAANPIFEWMSSEPVGTYLTVEVRAADTLAELPSHAFVETTNGDPVPALTGRFWEIQVTFLRDPGVEDTAILYELSVSIGVPGWMDIKPGSCPNSFNAKQKGKLPVALLGTEDFDVSEVDLDTLLLSRMDGVGGSIAPLHGPPGPGFAYDDVAAPFMGEPCDCDMLGSDGFMDLEMKFSSADLVEALELDGMIPLDGMVPVVLTGSFVDGTPFEAVDCLRLTPSSLRNFGSTFSAHSAK